MSCTSCTDPNKDYKNKLGQALISAQQKASEQKKPFAICEDEAQGTLYVLDAFQAYGEHHHVIQVISGLANPAG